ncbi:MAG: cation-translocating P-type ATPase [Ottowia sp.]|nr:cadmium-translocating P-type ATPase [Ottowia sp.]
MNKINQWINGRWTIPGLAGLLILASFTAARGLDAAMAAQALMVAAAVVAGLPILRNAIRALTVRNISIDLLVSIAAIGALIIGEYWEAAAVTFLFAIGHALESATLNKTRAALAELIAVAPDTAVVMRDGEQVEISASSVAMGEVVLVKNGAKVPVDGQVIAGTGALDEATITGESIPVEKSKGDHVFAGTISRGGFLQVLATGIGADTTLARIIHRVEDAQDAKARTQKFMDRFSRWYTPGVIVMSLLAWLISGSVVLALTLLVVACPGALVISIPVSIVAGIGRSARDGILIKGGEFLETAAKIDVVAVDKTGTLTKGRPQLTDVVALAPDFSKDDVLRWAARAEAGSEHPLARPILDAAEKAGMAAGELPEQIEPVAGKGITARVDGQQVLIGNLALLQQYGVADTVGAHDRAQQLAEQGRTPMIVAVGEQVLGVIAVADEIRRDAAAMVAELHRAGVKKVIMLTGDVKPVADAVAAATGIDEVYAGLLPEDKLEIVARLQRAGHVVAMVGDGVNDAPALATADVGVAMGAAGSAVAVETADIALMGDDLLKLPQAIAMARRTLANIRQNMVVALATVTLLLAGVLMGGVTMALGMLVHEGSVLVVIANAMRLLRRRPARGVASHATATGATEDVLLSSVSKG